MTLLGQAVELSPVATALKERIGLKEALVAVIGAGYVGLPLAVEKAKVGFGVVCVEQNPNRAQMINEGRNYIRDVKDEELAKLVRDRLITATTSFAVLGEADVVIICVPTPLTENKDPDISYIVNVTREIASHLHVGQLISLESTTYPGTTEEVILPMLAPKGLRVGEDYFVSFSPERVDPGNARYTTKNTNKVVGGVTPACLDVATTLYQQTILSVVPVSSPKVAEMTKVFENTYRAVNIALVNELAMLCDRMGIDVWEVVQAASTKPFGIQTFWPGPGVGGHCIPLDPFYLAWKAREYDFSTRFIELAGEINLRMPYFVKDKVVRALGEAGRPLYGSNILVLGVAYKRDIADERESPALKIIQLLQKEGAQVSYHDPFIPEVHPHGWFKEHMTSVPLSDELWQQVDAVVVATDHTNVDYEMVAQKAAIIIDTRNAMKNVRSPSAKIVKL
ncbi:MAG: nucleotide sugar dehydrogenase [Bacillota bacterium]